MDKAMKIVELRAKAIALLEVKQHITKEIERLDKEIAMMERNM